MIKIISKLLVIAALVLPVQFIEASRKNKTLCSLLVCKCFQSNGTSTFNGPAIFNDTLTLGGVDLSSLVTLAEELADSDGALGTLVSSIIPYSSGLLTVATSFPGSVFPTTGLVMAFGSSNLEGIVDTGITARNTSYAFTVPAAGTLHHLRVSADSVYTLGAPATAFTLTYTLLVSHCTTGTVTAYTPTSLSATATITPPATAILAPGGAGCGSNAGSITVAAGDRVVLLVTPSVAIPTLQ